MGRANKNGDEQIEIIVDWFFEKINMPIIQSLYIGELQNWDALCSSLTILNDLQRAKSEYKALKAINHLEAIGIMQTLYIEQDCMLTLKNALFKTKEKAALENYKPIREMRNEAFGHPSEKGRKTGNYSRHFFDIIDAKEQLFKIINWENTGDITSGGFRMPEKVSENSRITLNYLEEFKANFITNIKTQMQTYKIKSTDLFRNTGYVFEKLLTKENDHFAISSYDHSVEHEIEKAKEALVERNVFDDEFKREIDVAMFFSTRLKELFGHQTCRDTEFYAYASTLRQKLEEIKKSIKDLEKYSDIHEFRQHMYLLQQAISED